MAIKKSELYSALWASCDELRGGMDASQYKDYILVLLFIKYISDKYSGVQYADITIPDGASFKDISAFKGKSDIGDRINKITGKLAEANDSLAGCIDVADFNDENKLGKGKEMVDKLTGLVTIFENPKLDFKKNKAEGDDLLGDAYEYLMRHFATESGKSKGQFYTPAEVSKVMSQILGVSKDEASSSTTVYDPTCGSGSLLLKVADEFNESVSLYGQEKDIATSALAKMNMVLHGYATAEIEQGNTLAEPKFKDEYNNSHLKSFDFVVANPPFSFKAWSNGVDTDKDKYERFQDYGVPPEKNGDYAFMLHIIKSLKSNGKGAVILPHGVLFRGNSEETIRRNIIDKGLIKGIIGLPPNLFYGTGIPACILVLDKEGANNRQGIFMIDASKGFMKDGNKNRLRSQDIHKIVDTFNNYIETPKYSRLVSLTEIREKDYNLNLPRYIDSHEEEDIQDIKAHLQGGIPARDIEQLQEYWNAYPSLQNVLFEKAANEGYFQLRIEPEAIRETIFSHNEYMNYSKTIDNAFIDWFDSIYNKLINIEIGTKPRNLIFDISESLLARFSGFTLIDKYDIYQHLMNYWSETMQDDVFVIASEGWIVANDVRRDVKETKNNKYKKVTKKDVEGLEGIKNELIPPELLVSVYFQDLNSEINSLETKLADLASEKVNIEEEQKGSEDDLLADVRNDKDQVNKKLLESRLKTIKSLAGLDEEKSLLNKYLDILKQEKDLKDSIKEKNKELEALVWNKYSGLSLEEIKDIIVKQKWYKTLKERLEQEQEIISQKLNTRITELNDRYDSPLPSLISDMTELETNVKGHLEKMGYAWI